MLLVGFADNALIKKANQQSSGAILVTEGNYSEFIINSNWVGYTGFEEFIDKAKLLELLESAHDLEYYPAGDSTDYNRISLEQLLSIVHASKPIKNFNINFQKLTTLLDSYLELSDLRKTESVQLWSVGASITYGTGNNLNDRYSNIVSDRLNKSLSCLSLPGSSPEWAADQILRSDIRSGDIVVWNITSKCRYTVFDQGRKIPVYPGIHHLKEYNGVPLSDTLKVVWHEKILTEHDHFQYQLLTHVHQIINYCNKIGAKLLLLGILVDSSDLFFLKSLDNYCHVFNDKDNWIDWGTDNIHPGPKQHAIYADIIIKELTNRGWI